MITASVTSSPGIPRRFLHFLPAFRQTPGRRKLLVFNLDPSVAIASANDRMMQHDVFLHHIVFKFAPDQALDRKQCVLRIRHCLRLAFWPTRISPSSVYAIIDGVVRRLPSSRCFRITIKNSHTKVGCSQVDSDDFPIFCLRNCL